LERKRREEERELLQKKKAQQLAEERINFEQNWQQIVSFLYTVYKRFPPLVKSNLIKKMKYRIVLIFFVSKLSEIEGFGQFMALKIGTVKLKKSHMT